MRLFLMKVGTTWLLAFGLYIGLRALLKVTWRQFLAGARAIWSIR